MMVQGLKNLNRKMRKTIPQAARAAVREAMEQGATELVAAMKSFAPEDTGALKDSIGWTWGQAPEGAVVLGRTSKNADGERITIYAGNRATMVTNARGIEFQNARIQEFGTKAMPANPYFFPIWRLYKKRIKSRMTRRINKAIKAGAKS